MNIETIKNYHFSIIGQETSLRGDLVFHGVTYIAGKIFGTVKMNSSDRLILERSAWIEGEITSFDLEIHGTFIGEIKCSGTVTIKASANVEGKIVAQNLIIYPGANVNLEAKAIGDLHSLQK